MLDKELSISARRSEAGTLTDVSGRAAQAAKNGRREKTVMEKPAWRRNMAGLPDE
jgi:hypothetical protein